jgi:glyoxylase-like metal-dependent hydrolase (beta-lactamase superfamily II)
MGRWVKRVSKILGALVLVLAVSFGVAAYSAFGGMSAIEDGAEPAPGVRVVKDGFVGVGLVDVGGGKLALVDAGADATGKAILAELARRGASPDAVVAIFVTHGHGDHTAACALFPNAAVYALAADVGLVEGREGAHGPVTRWAKPKPTGIHVARGLADGETVEVGSKKVQVFAVPGHTAGSAAYLVGGVLFVGDSAGTRSDGSLAGAPWIFSDDRAQNHASVAALGARLAAQKEHVVAIVPAHTGTATFEALSKFVP